MGSSSGTFLNCQRLSPANTQSEPFQLTDGDILRIGTSYHGGIPGKHAITRGMKKEALTWGKRAFNHFVFLNLHYPSPLERFRCINLRVRIFYRPQLNTYA